jgi:hypothetical protein
VKRKASWLLREAHANRTIKTTTDNAIRTHAIARHLSPSVFDHLTMIIQSV